MTSNNKTKGIIILETVGAGAMGGIARVQWERMNTGISVTGVTPDYLTFAFMAGFAALAFILAFELTSASWTKRLGIALLAGFFFQTLINSGHLEAQLIQQQSKTDSYIEDVAQVSIESDSTASQEFAIETLEGIALDDSETENSHSTAIAGLTEVTEASEDFQIKMKAVASLEKIALSKAKTEQEKTEIIEKLRQMEAPFPSKLHTAIEDAIANIETSLE